MRWMLLVAAFLVLAAPASASGPSNAQLQRQITALKAQVKALQVLQNQQHDELVCEHALAGDTANFVWHQVMQLFSAVFNTGVPSDLARFDDGGACQRTGTTRIR